MGFWQNILNKIGKFLDRFEEWLNPRPEMQQQQPQQGTPLRSSLEVAEDRYPRQERAQARPAQDIPMAPSSYANQPMTGYDPGMQPEAGIPPLSQPQQAYQAFQQMPGVPASPSPYVTDTMQPEPQQPVATAASSPTTETARNPEQTKSRSETQGGKFGLSAYEAAEARHQEKTTASAIMKEGKLSETKGGKFGLSPYEAALQRHEEKEAVRSLAPAPDAPEKAPSVGAGNPGAQTDYTPQQEVLPPEQTSSRKFGVYISGDVQGAAISARNADVVVGGNVKDSHIAVESGGVAVGGSVRNSVIEQNGSSITPQMLSGEHKAALDSAIAGLGILGGGGQVASGRNVTQTQSTVRESSRSQPQPPAPERQNGQTYIPVNYGIVDDPNAVVGTNYGIMSGGTLSGDNYGIADDAVLGGNNYGIASAGGDDGRGSVTSASMGRGGSVVSVSGNGNVIMQAGSVGHASVVMGDQTGVSGGVVHGDVVMGGRGGQGASVVMGNQIGVSAGVVHGDVIMQSGNNSIGQVNFGKGSNNNFGGNSVVGNNNTVTTGDNSPVTIRGRGNGGSAVTFGDNSPITIDSTENGHTTVRSGNMTITGMTGSIYTVQGGGMTIRDGEASVNLQENGRATAIAVGPEQSAKMTVQGRDGNNTVAHAQTGREGGVAAASIRGDVSRISLNLGGGSHVGGAASQPDRAPTVPRGGSGPAQQAAQTPGGGLPTTSAKGMTGVDLGAYSSSRPPGTPSPGTGAAGPEKSSGQSR